MTIGYGTKSISAEVEEIEFERREVGPTDIGFDVLYCGICHSDFHSIKNDWGNTLYPSIPGHEIIGKVTSVGAKATLHKIGDMVAVGTFIDSCRDCDNCVGGLEIYCRNGKQVLTYNSKLEDGSHTYGGYSKYMVVNEKYALRVPSGLDASRAPPLLCAGITVFDPLVHWGAGPGKKVAVAGIGGLGHLAVKFASALGAEVTVITRSESKVAESKRLGADYVLLKDETKSNYFDIIIDTIPYEHSLDRFIDMLAFDGTIANVGNITKGDFYGGPLNLKRGKIVGSASGGLRQTQAMLDFCAKKGITADCEIVGPNEINKSFERMHKGDVKYRFVIDMSL